MNRSPHRSSARVPAAAAATLGALTLAVYVALLAGEGDSPFRPRALVFVAGIAVATGAAAFGAVHPGRRVARPALAVATALFAVLGVLGIFSIGLPLTAAAGLSVVAAGRVTAPRRARPGGGAPRR